MTARKGNVYGAGRDREVRDDALEMTDPGLGLVHGPTVLRDYLATLKRAVPDAKAVVERMLESGDTVVEGRFVGTFTGPLTSDDGDIDPTGATVDLRFADVPRVRKGKLVSYHTYYDQADALVQRLVRFEEAACR